MSGLDRFQPPDRDETPARGERVLKAERDFDEGKARAAPEDAKHRRAVEVLNRDLR